MIAIPDYMLFLIPVLTVWWTHRRGARREYWILAASVLALCMPLFVLAYYHHMTSIGNSPVGIETVQLPLSVVVTATLSAIPVKWKFVRNFVAILVGEVLLAPTWIS